MHPDTISYQLRNNLTINNNMQTFNSFEALQASTCSTHGTHVSSNVVTNVTTNNGEFKNELKSMLAKLKPLCAEYDKATKAFHDYLEEHDYPNDILRCDRSPSCDRSYTSEYNLTPEIKEHLRRLYKAQCDAYYPFNSARYDVKERLVQENMPVEYVKGVPPEHLDEKDGKLWKQIWRIFNPSTPRYSPGWA